MASLGQNEANNHHTSEGNMVEQDCKISSSDYPSAAATRPTNGTSSNVAEVDDSDPVQPSASSNGTNNVNATPVDEESPSTGNLDDEDLSNEGVGILSSTYAEDEQKNNNDPSGDVLPCDSVSSSSCPVSTFNAGPSGGDIDSEVQGGSGQYHQVTSGAEDDAGSSSHSEVRSSSPGVADADADVEDSPSGEETGSESEQRSNHHSGAGGTGIEPTSSSGIMYAPNTVGFPPSRATTLSTAGCFGSSYKFASSSGSSSSNGSSSSQNPFAPRLNAGGGGFAAVAASTTSSSSTFRGRGERCTSSSSNTGYGSSSNTGFGSLSGRGATSSSLISPGRFNTAGSGSLPSSSSSTSPNVAPSSSSWSSRSIIRPSALGSSLGAGGVNPSESAPSSIFGGASSSSSAFPNYFAMSSGGSRGADSSENGEGPRSFVLKPSRLATTAGSSFGATSTTGETANVPETSSSTDRSTEGTENGGPVFVPLANKDTEIKAENPTPAPVTTSTATSSSDSGGFVFGQGLQDRVSSMGESAGVSNGIGSSSGADGGLFSSALQNLHKDSSKSVAREDEAGPSSTSETRSAFGSADDEAQGERKRKYDDAPVLTGEEDEMNVLQIMCKLFIFDKETANWTERGRGQLRLNDRNDPDSHELRSRLIIRTKGSLRLMLNTNVWTGMQIGKPSAKSVRFTAVENGQVRLFLVVVSVNEAEQLYNALDWRLKNLKQQEENIKSSQPNEEAPSTSKSDVPEAVNDEQSDDDEDHNDDMPAKKKRYVASSPGEPSSRKSSGDYSAPNSQNPSIQVTNHDEAP